MPNHIDAYIGQMIGLPREREGIARNAPAAATGTQAAPVESREASAAQMSARSLLAIALMQQLDNRKFHADLPTGDWPGAPGAAWRCSASAQGNNLWLLR